MSAKKRILITGSTNASSGTDTQDVIWSALYDVLDEAGLTLEEIAIMHFGQKGVDQAVVAACRNNNVTHVPVPRRDGETPKKWQNRPFLMGAGRTVLLTTPGSRQNERVRALAEEAGSVVTEIPIPKKGQ